MNKKLGTKQVLKYALLPAIVPRFRILLTTGFGHISFFMAQVYRAARLLPAGHPYLNPANAGRFGVRHVVAETASRLRFRRENLDQILIFFVVLAGLMLLFVQFCLLGLGFFVGSAHAVMPTNFLGFFGTPPDGDGVLDDVAFVMLDRVFGVPNFFTATGGQATCVAQNLSCFQFLNPALNVGQAAAPAYLPPGDGPFPWPFHVALRAMFNFYSIGLLVVAALIFCYFIFVVVAETAQTGTPFGRRFNHVWAPLRIVAAIGLLIPVANGLNAAQYITLYAAKWGSGFATNGWNMFTTNAIVGTNTLAGNNVAGGARLVATPEPPEVTNLVEFATVWQACGYAEDIKEERRPPGAATGILTAYEVKPYLVKAGGQRINLFANMGLTYQQALQFYDFGDISIVFGVCRAQAAAAGGQDTASCDDNGSGVGGSGIPVYGSWPGFVAQVCGEIVLQTTGVSGSSAAGSPNAGSVYILEQYWELMKGMALGTLAVNPIFDPTELWGIAAADCYANKTLFPCTSPPMPDTVGAQTIIADWKTFVQAAIAQGALRAVADPNWAFAMRPLGWGGAGLWYNKIAQLNGGLIAAAYSLPYVRHYPFGMEEVRRERNKQAAKNSGRENFKPEFPSGKDVSKYLQDSQNIEIAQTMWYAFDFWTSQYGKPTGNTLVDYIRSFLGLEGLYNIRNNLDVHPLAQLVAVGKSLVDSAINNIGASLVSMGGGIAMLFSNQKVGNGVIMLSDMVFSISMVALGIGFILFYVVPFLPFIYFFFAVAAWVKGIFEAMVGVPLWALAHIRIDGDGLPGDAAMGGYWLILEIFLRPILIVFGLLASILLFAAQVRVLNEIWPLVTSNLAGFNTVLAPAAPAGETGSIQNYTDVVNQFFFTVIYTIVVYMTGVSSFKLVDLIPHNTLRWMGATVQSFADQTDDPTDNLVRNVSIGTNQIGGALSQGMSSVSGGVQKMAARFQQKDSG